MSTTITPSPWPAAYSLAMHHAYCGVQVLTSCSSSPMVTSVAWCQLKGSWSLSRRASSLLQWVELWRSGSFRWLILTSHPASPTIGLLPQSQPVAMAWALCSRCLDYSYTGQYTVYDCCTAGIGPCKQQGTWPLRVTTSKHQRHVTTSSKAAQLCDEALSRLLQVLTLLKCQTASKAFLTMEVAAGVDEHRWRLGWQRASRRAASWVWQPMQPKLGSSGCWNGLARWFWLSAPSSGPLLSPMPSQTAFQVCH